MGIERTLGGIGAGAFVASPILYMLSQFERGNAVTLSSEALREGFAGNDKEYVLDKIQSAHHDQLSEGLGDLAWVAVAVGTIFITAAVAITYARSRSSIA